jgi:hypothetical protein
MQWIHFIFKVLHSTIFEAHELVIYIYISSAQLPDKIWRVLQAYIVLEEQQHKQNYSLWPNK